jgi:hypothetical protein
MVAHPSRGGRDKYDSAPYVGYECHLAVQARDVRWTNGIDQLTFGDDVPAVITSATLTPAGTHRAAVVPRMIELAGRGLPIDEVVWDRGYSQLLPETTAHPLHRAGIDQAFRPMEHQRKPRPFTDDAILVEGQLFSAHVPDDLRGPLPMPPIGATDEELRKFEKPFNLRARYRYQRHEKPDADGASRWKCPFHAGFLRSRQLRRTMRSSRAVPLVELPEGSTCCNGILGASAQDLPLWQRLSPGTTAWRISMGRRQLAEGANAGLKGGFTDVTRKCFRVFGRIKTMFLLAFTIAGYNRDRIRAFRVRQAAEAGAPKTRARRRRGTHADLIGALPSASGRAPPGQPTGP